MKEWIVVVAVIFFILQWGNATRRGSIQPQDYEGKIVKGTRNALFLVQNGQRKMFPDFNTFKTMGYNLSVIENVGDEVLKHIPLGPNITPIPIFRPEDYMYHLECEDADRMVNDLGIVANMGNLIRFAQVYSRIKNKKSLEILFLGGSITAGGYFMEFIKLLEQDLNIKVVYHNHGHGATEITYTIFCVDLEKYRPDLVFIDFAVNDYGHPKLMDNLIRKTLAMPSNPVVTLMNLWVTEFCPVTRYLLHAYYYQIPVLNVCPAVNLCYGKTHLPKHIFEEYSLTDGVHPWGTKGVKFLGDLMFAWWKRLVHTLTHDTTMDTSGRTITFTHSFDKLLDGGTANSGNNDENAAHIEYGPRTILPPPLYDTNPIGLCTRCDALTDDAEGKLVPVGEPKGFKVVTRVKVGYGGFNPSDRITPTKSMKRSWQADEIGSEISFKFYGSAVKVAIWQRRDGMGILDAFVDGNENQVAKASGFFKGYTWAMEKNNTGRSEIIPLFEGLKDTQHTITFRVSDKPANPWVRGHMVQIFALLSASDDVTCKSKI